ncbi:hypothetical protein D3C74_442710 [compost metagenome]
MQKFIAFVIHKLLALLKLLNMLTPSDNRIAIIHTIHLEDGFPHGINPFLLRQIGKNLVGPCLCRSFN